MATGWAELLKWIRRRAAEDAPDLEATWTRFQKVAAASERRDVLKYVVRVGRVLPDEERYRLAVAVTRLLAPFEWPPPWSEVRPALVTALDALVVETDPDAEGFFAAHDLGADAELQRVGHLVLHSACDLLRKPCRRDQLHTVARLCNAGTAACLHVYRRAIRQNSEDALIDDGARARFRSAFEAYAEAAGALNNAAGAVLFEGLDAQLP